MIYIEQDFYLNFINAVKSNDDNSIQSMLSDEVSRLISQRKDLIDLFGKININYTEKPTNEELTELIITNMPTDHKLRVGLAYLIAKNNNIILPKKDDSKDESKDGKNKVDTVTSISTAISSFIKTNKNNFDSFKEEIIEKSNNKSPNFSEFSMNKREEIKKQEAPKEVKKNKTWMWVLLGLVVIGGGIYLAHKKGFIKFGKGDLNAPDLSNANVSGDISNLNTPSLENPIQVNNIP